VWQGGEKPHRQGFRSLRRSNPRPAPFKTKPRRPGNKAMRTAACAGLQHANPARGAGGAHGPGIVGRTRGAVGAAPKKPPPTRRTRPPRSTARLPNILTRRKADPMLSVASTAPGSSHPWAGFSLPDDGLFVKISGRKTPCLLFKNVLLRKDGLCLRVRPSGRNLNPKFQS